MLDSSTEWQRQRRWTRITAKMHDDHGYVRLYNMDHVHLQNAGFKITWRSRGELPCVPAQVASLYDLLCASASREGVDSLLSLVAPHYGPRELVDLESAMTRARLQYRWLDILKWLDPSRPEELRARCQELEVAARLAGAQAFEQVIDQYREEDARGWL